MEKLTPIAGTDPAQISTVNTNFSTIDDIVDVDYKAATLTELTTNYPPTAALLNKKARVTAKNIIYKCENSTDYGFTACTYTYGTDASKPASGYYYATDTLVWYYNGSAIVVNAVDELPDPSSSTVGVYYFPTKLYLVKDKYKMLDCFVMTSYPNGLYTAGTGFVSTGAYLTAFNLDIQAYVAMGYKTCKIKVTNTTALTVGAYANATYSITYSNTFNKTVSVAASQTDYTCTFDISSFTTQSWLGFYLSATGCTLTDMWLERDKASSTSLYLGSDAVQSWLPEQRLDEPLIVEIPMYNASTWTTVTTNGTYYTIEVPVDEMYSKYIGFEQNDFEIPDPYTPTAYALVKENYCMIDHCDSMNGKIKVYANDKLTCDVKIRLFGL